MTQPAADALPLDPPVAVSSGSGVPAWLHLVVAWTLALAALVIIGVLLALSVPVPAALWTVLGVSVGGALGLTSPLALLARA